MHKITEFVLKRPVTTFLVVVSLIFFGFMSITNQKMELMSDIEMPMMIVTTTYAGASPEDVDKLITKPIEDGVSVLSDVKEVTSRSAENYGMTIIQYEYGTDMDEAYDALKKKMDAIKSKLPDGADDPTFLEMSMNGQPSMYLTIQNPTQENMYNYVENDIAPEFNKLSTVASVDTTGGQKQYVQIQLIPEKLKQYHLSMSTVAACQCRRFQLSGGYDQRRQPGSFRHHLGQLPGCAVASEYPDRHRKRQYDLPEGHRPRAARTGGQGGHRPL